jgi:hypothetical protein
MLLGFYPGHLKWDYAYSIGELKPEVVLEQWKTAPGESVPLRVTYYHSYIDGRRWYFRGNSAHIRRDTLGDNGVQ